jgi:glycerol-3-phosphate dehydrogenase (NAD+)
VIIHCIPAQHTPKFVQSIASKIPSDVPYVSTAKGIHVATHSLMSEAIPRALGEHAKRVQLAYLSGPSFAKEMVKGHPVSVIVASYALGDGTKPPQPETAMRVQKILNAERFRIYVSDDVIGVEVGGALKNPLAIGAGMAIGCGFGQSTIAGIVTRGCREMRLLTVALGGRPETLAGLSGIGDLMLTCFSSLSRNNRCGRALAQGKTADEITKEMGEVVEGVPTASEVVSLAKTHKLHLPLFFAVNEIIAGRLTAESALRVLMRTPPGKETFT